MRTATAIGTAIIALSVGTGAHAQSPTEVYGENDVPAILKQMQANGTQFDHLGVEGGLHGFLARNENGEKQTLYVSPDGRHIITGVMFDGRGSNVTGLQLARTGVGSSGSGNPVDNEGERTSTGQTGDTDEAATGSTGSKAEKTGSGQATTARSLSVTPKQFRQYVDSAATMEAGAEGKPSAYVLVDPIDQESQAVWNAIKPMVSAGQVDVTVVPVALTNEGVKAVGALMSRDNPMKAWTKGPGHIRSLISDAQNDTESAAFQDPIRRNAKFVQQAGITSAPVVLAVSNGLVRYHDGEPAGAASFLKNTLGFASEE